VSGKIAARGAGAEAAGDAIPLWLLAISTIVVNT
jgi:hypothetical protein